MPRRRALKKQIGNQPDHADLGQQHDEPVEATVLHHSRAHKDCAGMLLDEFVGLRTELLHRRRQVGVCLEGIPCQSRVCRKARAQRLDKGVVLRARVGLWWDQGLRQPEVQNDRGHRNRQQCNARRQEKWPTPARRPLLNHGR